MTGILTESDEFFRRLILTPTKHKILFLHSVNKIMGMAEKLSDIDGTNRDTLSDTVLRTYDAVGESFATIRYSLPHGIDCLDDHGITEHTLRALRYLTRRWDYMLKNYEPHIEFEVLVCISKMYEWLFHTHERQTSEEFYKTFHMFLSMLVLFLTPFPYIEFVYNPTHVVMNFVRENQPFDNMSLLIIEK